MASPFDDDPLMAAAAPSSSAVEPVGSVKGGQASKVAPGGDIMDGFDAGQPPVVLGGDAPAADLKSNKADIKAAEPEVPKGPTPYSVWEGKRTQILAERAAKANEAKKAIAAQAKEDIAKFYAQRTERIASNKQQNRLDEKSTKAEIATLFQFGAQWEKVGKLINIAPKANEKRSVDRMRKLLLTLKNDDPKKPAGSSGASSSADSKSGK